MKHLLKLMDLSEKEIIESYGAWFPGFYDCGETELWIKSVFCGPIFVFGIFLTGLFIFGHLFVYPVTFYYGYTFGFLITCTIICFGMSGTPYILFRLPSTAITSMPFSTSSLATAIPYLPNPKTAYVFFAFIFFSFILH